MAEFVQKHLEELLGVFTSLKKSKLFTPVEVKSVIERVRQFDYSINKRTKRPKDFLQYAEYLGDVAELIHKRRLIKQKTLKLKAKIEEPLKKHIAHLYRICSERFRKLEYFKKEIAFLQKTHQHGLCSIAYSRLLQFHGNNPKNHEEAALWEFFENKSSENSRTILQYAVRKFPQDVNIRVAFVKVEAGYVNVMHDRRLLLAAMKDTTDEQNAILMSMENVDDAVFDCKLIELVITDALETLENNHGEFLLKSFLALRELGNVVKKATDFIVEQFESVEDVEEEETIVNTIQDWPLKFDILDAYIEALKKTDTPRMHRLTAEVAEKAFEATGDDHPKNVLIAQLEKLHQLNEATPAEYEKFMALNEIAGDENTANVVASALQQDPTNASNWEKFLAFKVNKHINDSTSVKADEIMNTFDDALEKVHADESLPIWRLLIDFTVNKFPSTVIDAAFDRALLQTRSAVHGSIKEIRLNYVKTVYPEDPQKYESEYQKLASIAPTSVQMHLDYIESLSNAEKKTKVFDVLVAEHGKSVHSWLQYGAFMLQTKPSAVQKIYQRATVNIDSKNLEYFNEEWTLMMKNDTGY